MKNLIKIKGLTVLAFLLIIYPGKLAVFNGLSLLLGIVVNISELFYPEGNFIRALPSLIYVSTLILSVVFLFKRNKYITLICIVAQYASIFHMSKIKFLYYWYYTLPTSIYFILSLVIFYVLFVKRHPKKVIGL